MIIKSTSVGFGVALTTVAIILGLAPSASPQVSVKPVPQVLVVVPHADDWQIFVGDRIAQALESGAHVTIVQVTGGGGACYEKGHIASVITSTEHKLKLLPCSGSDAASYRPAQCDPRPRNVLGHPLKRCSYKNAEMFFLNLPDAFAPSELRNPEDNRYIYQPKAVRGTLYTLYVPGGLPLSPNIRPLATLDRSTTYQSFDDLARTIAAIWNTWNDPANTATRTIYTFNPDGSDERLNRDHYDHVLTGRLVLAAYDQFRTRTILFSGYNSLNAPKDTFEEQSPQVDVKKLIYMQSFARSVEFTGLDQKALNSAQSLTYLKRTITQEVGSGLSDAELTRRPLSSLLSPECSELLNSYTTGLNSFPTGKRCP